jgi:hypothetical protein
MALGHFFTNRGKHKVATTNMHGATNLYMGLLQLAGGAPAGIDTAAEIADLDTVTALLAVTNVDEAVGGSYARQNLTSVTSTEDDTNDRENLDAANAVFSAVAAGAEIYGGFISQGTGVDGDDLISVFILRDSGSGAGVTPNGSDITATISDFARLS